MRNQRTQKILQKSIPRIFMLIGVPLVSMYLTFHALDIFIPDNVVSSNVNSTTIKVSSQKNTPKASVPVLGPPVRLQISTIGVDTVVDPVGVSSSGAMDVGENPDRAAWYEPGIIPSQIGSAVIAGHYGWGKNGHASVFNNLNKLQPGDRLSVYDVAGIETAFIVRETRLYDPADNTSDVFMSSDGLAHLNLITCQGAWDKANGSYSDRLVVFADLKQK